jgi:hypothetical protein
LEMGLKCRTSPVPAAEAGFIAWNGIDRLGLQIRLGTRRECRKVVRASREFSKFELVRGELVGSLDPPGTEMVVPASREF